MIVIVTDSTAYITRQEAREYGIVCVPMTYSVDGKQYTERFIDDSGDYVERISATNDLKTSQASIDVYDKLFQGLRESGYEVLCLTLSSRLSGTYSNAYVCARDLNHDGIRVVDTATTAGGMRIMIKEARRLIESGMTLEQVAEAISNLRNQIRTIFSVTDLTPLRRSGRLGPVRQSISTILNIRPILTLEDGAIVATGTVRGRNEQLKSMVEAVPSTATNIAVQYISSKEDADVLAQRLQERCNQEVELRTAGPVLGIHLGLDALSIVWCNSK